MTHFNFLILMISKCFSAHNFMWRAYTVSPENNFTDARITHNEMIFTSHAVLSKLAISHIQMKIFYSEYYYDMIILILNTYLYHIENQNEGNHIPIYNFPNSLKIMNPRNVLKIANKKIRTYNLQYRNLGITQKKHLANMILKALVSFVIICLKKYNFTKVEFTNEDEEKYIFILMDIMNHIGELMRTDAMIKYKKEEKHENRKAKSYFVYFLSVIIDDIFLNIMLKDCNKNTLIEVSTIFFPACNVNNYKVDLLDLEILTGALTLPTDDENSMLSISEIRKGIKNLNLILVFQNYDLLFLFTACSYFSFTNKEFLREIEMLKSRTAKKLREDRELHFKEFSYYSVCTTSTTINVYKHYFTLKKHEQFSKENVDFYIAYFDALKDFHKTFMFCVKSLVFE